MFIQKKLGLTKEAFEECINRDVEELLREIEETRFADNETQLPQEEIPPTTSDAHAEKPISKDECFRMLCDKELTTGSMLGNYMWATNRFEARYNFKRMTWDAEGIDLMNADNF